jgi:hypothetical protein
MIQNDEFEKAILEATRGVIEYVQTGYTHNRRLSVLIPKAQRVSPIR